MEASNIEEKQDSKAWLQKLKEESWEAELLIEVPISYWACSLEYNEFIALK